MKKVLDSSQRIFLSSVLILAALVVWLSLPQGATFGSIATNLFPDNGNVGIGTTSPDAPLHVNGSGGSGDILVDSTHERGSLTSFRKGGAQHAGIGMTGKIEGDQTEDLGLFSETGQGLRFYVNGSATEVAVINSSGNVGIGTTSPKSSLHVANGYIQFPTTFVPPQGDCSSDDHVGRAVVMPLSNGVALAVCYKGTSSGQFGWQFLD